MKFTQHQILLLSLFSLPSSIWAGSIPITTSSSPLTSLPTPSLPPATSFPTLLPSQNSTATQPPLPNITTPPAIPSAGFRQKWHIETYSTCVTWRTGYTHCGFHAPVRPGGDEIAGAERIGGVGVERVWWVVVGVGMVVVGGLMM